MAIRAADAGNYPWQKNAAGTYAATANGTSPGGKQGGCVLLIKAILSLRYTARKPHKP